MDCRGHTIDDSPELHAFFRQANNLHTLSLAQTVHTTVALRSAVSYQVPLTHLDISGIRCSQSNLWQLLCQLHRLHTLVVTPSLHTRAQLYQVVCHLSQHSLRTVRVQGLHAASEVRAWLQDIPVHVSC